MCDPEIKYPIRHFPSTSRIHILEVEFIPSRSNILPQKANLDLNQFNTGVFENGRKTFFLPSKKKKKKGYKC